MTFGSDIPKVQRGFTLMAWVIQLDQHLMSKYKANAKAKLMTFPPISAVSCVC